MMKDVIIEDITTSDGVVGQIGRRGSKYFTNQYGEAFSRDAGRKFQTFHTSKTDAEKVFKGMKEYYGA